jgi:ATP phosphoribosyltransferase regulatory subunit
MTMQVARIACSRLAHRPRPLRLGYAGQVVRVRGTQLRPERQFGQVGAEIVGTDTPAADVEVIVMATQALSELGVSGLTVDLGLPTLVPAMLADAIVDTATEDRLRLALDRKDLAAITALAPVLGDARAAMLARLVASGGPADGALAALHALDLPPAAAAERARLRSVHDQLRRESPMLTLTIDAVETRGFEYHSGVTYALFATSAPDEIGRGGRYRTQAGEASTGVTLFIDSVLRALARPPAEPRLLLPVATPPEVALRLRRDGWIAMRALQDGIDPIAEAARLGCTHVLIDGTPRPLDPAARPSGEG